MTEEQKNSHFKLHLPATPVKKHVPEAKNHNEEKREEKHEKRTVKSIIKDAARQIIVSAIILTIGFLVLNSGAYYKIIKNEVYKILDIEQQSPLQELVDNNTKIQTDVLKTSSDPEIQKKQIPQLNLEIAPPDNRIIIPRINQNIPIVRISSDNLIRRDWDALEEEMQKALKSGVVHYPGTALPGQTGNIVITGHSSYFPWDPGRFKDVFALLHDVVKGDKILIYYEQKEYIYEVFQIDVVLPEDIDILKQTPEDQLTLITCTPVGTNLKRLIVKARPIEINGQKIEQKITR